MDFDSARRLRTSSSRNFSRPFPSPLSTGALNTPTMLSKKREFLAQLPLSASHGNALRSSSSQGCLATNRLIDFDDAFQHHRPTTKYSHSRLVTWRTRDRDETPHYPPAFCSHPDTSADQDLGTTSPILYLRSNLWQILEPHRKVLNVDLFWPDDLDRVKARDDEQDLASTESERTAIFPYDGLKPLLLFRNLHTLTLNGMQRSYQRLIWATCWLNPKLTTLSLEMALEPLMNISSDVFQRKVDHTWSLPSAAAEGEETEYLGYHGTGVLHEEFGDGEYLDTQAIKLAQLEVAENIPETNMRYLPVVKLTLMNVVIDNGPILRWFDPEKLEELNLKDGCIDAGLYLADEMPKVRVLSPRPPKPICIAKAVRPGEAKLVELRNGKVVSRTEAKSVEHELYIKEHPLRHKFSQLLPKLSRAT